MSSWYLALAAILLVSIAAALWRVHRGPTAADRMMSAQLIGTGGVAVILLLAALNDDWAILDVAIVLALLAAFASVAFAKSASADGMGDPESDAEG